MDQSSHPTWLKDVKSGPPFPEIAPACSLPAACVLRLALGQSAEDALLSLPQWGCGLREYPRDVNSGSAVS